MDAAARLEQLFMQQFEMDEGLDQTVGADGTGTRRGTETIKPKKRKRIAEEKDGAKSAPGRGVVALGGGGKAGKKRRVDDGSHQRGSSKTLDSILSKLNPSDEDSGSESDEGGADSEVEVDSDADSFISDDSQDLMDGVEHDDTDDDEVNDKEVNAADKPKRSSGPRPPPGPIVVVASDPSARPRVSDGRSKADWKAFMSSKVSNLTASGQPPRKPESKADAAEDEEARRDDRELADLLKESGLIEEITTSSLPARDRRRHIMSRAASLGLAPEKSQQPLQVRLGIVRARHSRALSNLESARDQGVYASHLKGQLARGVGLGQSGGGSGVAELKEKKRERKVGRKEKEWATGGVGRVSGAVLRVTKEEMKRVEGSGGSGEGGKKAGRGKGHMKGGRGGGRGGKGGRGSRGGGGKHARY
ncbi:hypothetical protein M427DRAFT_354448 [Gonapodya prolifera JEL478]|uniref:Protein FAF1 n=1 Tax=Gonapodya prolifera (strain JEL478) TaxID=1344416 RepID=A0A139AC86_GONPJ|nr:hypothetical protein M427DRAFT_354448 [Gonapodya prolifera JEL478]|eukprot:KXS14085.1 hypothetical protein M427DRAFT_354448 [Gonapodya prolifera JEL478]